MYIPSERLRSRTWETVELRSVNVLVAAPVMSSILSPPAQVSFSVLTVNVSVVLSPRIVFPSTFKSPDTVVVALVILPASIKLLT